MERNQQDREIRREIQRLQGQLIVAKGICRENYEEIRKLREKFSNDEILLEAHRILAEVSSKKNCDPSRFNQLLKQIDEKRNLERTISNRSQTDESPDEENLKIFKKLSSNVAQAEALFNLGENLCTKPIGSLNLLNETTSLDEIGGESFSAKKEKFNENDLKEISKRIESMREKLSKIDRDDQCFVQ